MSVASYVHQVKMLSIESRKRPACAGPRLRQTAAAIKEAGSSLFRCCTRTVRVEVEDLMPQ